VSNKAHATGVVFIGWVVQTLELHVCFVGSRGHGAFLKNQRDWKHTALQQLCQEN
jgi:hypothetical protein